ncbi:MAG: C40 family peptidase [Betaproteobacteria bacterium]|nr:C40 family peptidase [Betaproteobacteria bacterium]
MRVGRREALLALAALAAGCAAPTAIGPPGRDRPATPIPPEIARDAAVLAVTLVGVPYRNGGASPDSGFDCSGLVWYVYRQAAGLALPRTTLEMERAGWPVDADEMQAGDLVFYNTLGRAFSHVGIYIGDRRFVHAPSSGGRVEIVSTQGGYWARRFSGARRVAT